MLDVHHCFEISSDNMCRLYNTAAMAAAEATEATAVVAAVAFVRFQSLFLGVLEVSCNL